jgi:hypothetical protein
VISKRAHLEKEKNALSRALERHRPLVDLTVSNPTTVGLPYDASLIDALADPKALVYTPEPLGIPAARARIAEMEGTSADRVMLTASTSEAYAMVLKLLCDPGDAILVPAPSYPLFGPLATFEGVRTIPYALRYDGAWHVDLATLASSEHARAIFCVSPNNPTGSVLRQDELDRMAELGLPIVIDEVFAQYMFLERPRARTDRVTTFRMGGLSKHCLLPQMKLAWTIVEGPRPPMRELEWLCDAYLSPNAPVQHALDVLLEKTELTRSALRDRLRQNLEHLRARTEGTPLTVLDVEGGWYACIRLPRTRSEEAWVLSLLDHGLLVHPGHFFDFQDEPYVVASLIARSEEFQRGTDILVGLVSDDRRKER